MNYKRLFLLILLSAFILSASKISLAEVNISDIPTPEKIQSFIPQPLTDLFKTFSNINIDFSKFSFLNQVVGAIPKSGEDVANGFRWLTRGLGNTNEWLKTHIGLNIVLVFQKVGEFFVWIFQGIANLIKAGLSFIK
ncbi:MAG: hypothetical protein Q8N22_00995 [bacterium]|nr:hypothetical protein [bacterium]